MNVTDTNSLTSYGLHVLALLAVLAVFFTVCGYAGRWLDNAINRYLTRKWRDATDEITEPSLAACRGHSTRIVRLHDTGYTVPGRLAEKGTRR